MKRWVVAVALYALLPAVVRAQQPDSEAAAPVCSHDGDSAYCDTLCRYSTVAEPADSVLAWPYNISARLDRLLADNIFTTSTVGLEVYDLTADSVVYAYNERQRLRPASTMKMVVAVAALDRLGGDYRLATELLYTGYVTDSTLHGDLYCRGGMDPLFNNDDMGAFIESLRSLGIDSIDGLVYADLSMKDSLPMGEGWCWDDDNPPLTPLLLGGKDRFITRLTNELRRELALRGAGYGGVATAPAEAKPLCRRFHTIDQVLMRMMKKSDNLFAEALFYNLAAAGGRRNVSAADGRAAVNRLVTKLGLKPRHYYIADGSGLSLYNYVSPHMEVAFLRYAYVNSNIYVHLLPSLPIAGVDGTLARRMRGTAAHRNVRAKTGTVEGVSALAGYCTAANGHHLCFAIINQGIRQAATGRRFQDRVCEALCR